MGPGSALSALHLHDGVIVVPPMEAVWLAGAEWELRDGRGCLSFEVKGETCSCVGVWGEMGGLRLLRMLAMPLQVRARMPPPCLLHDGGCPGLRPLAACRRSPHMVPLPFTALP